MRANIDNQEPILTLFLNFFPMQRYLAHLQELAKRKPGPKNSRHYIPWTEGMFLRFLGLLIRAAIVPLPNLEWHWRWPKDVPDVRGCASNKKWMTEVIFFRYWRFACIPGTYGGVEEAEVDEGGRTALYQVCV